VIPALVDYLALFYQQGNLTQVEVIARSMLAAIPDDIVALEFLALAIYQMGRTDDAHRAFTRIAARADQRETLQDSTACELASSATFRAATRADSGLADGWSRIAQILNKLGFQKPATRAFEAASASRGLLSAAVVHAEGLAIRHEHKNASARSDDDRCGTQ
jgi:predicted Zn-dependent protease